MPLETIHVVLLALAAQSAPAAPANSFGAPLPAGAAAEPPPAPPKPGPVPATSAPAPKSGGVPHVQRTAPVQAVPDAVWPHDPGLLRLEHERNALELVDHAATQAAEDAARRIAAMHAFIEQNNMAQDYAAFTRIHVPIGDQLTFDEAVERAMRQTEARRPQPQTNDLGHLEDAVEVEAGVARASFNRLNRSRRTVQMLGDFLERQNALGYYQAWAPGFMRSHGYRPQGPSQGQAPSGDAMQRRALQLEWDRAHRQQRASDSWQSGQAPAPDGPQAAPQGVPATYGTIPAPIQFGGGSPARGSNSLSWFNGYADPYYDMSGYPGRDPDADKPIANDPATYGYAPEAYTYQAWPMFWDLGPNVVPAFGMFPGGMVGGTGFGGGGAMGAAGGGR